MSHIHIPDGVLPVWLWVSGFIVAVLAGTLIARFSNREEMRRRLPLLGMMGALMVLGASVEIVPIAYHMNLTVVSGILMGPSMIFLATFVVNFILALFGHGGVTVIGLNTLTLSVEGILGYLFFRVFWRAFRRLALATFLATFLALLCSTFAMIGVISLGTSHYEELLHHEGGKGLFEFEVFKGEEGHSKAGHAEQKADLRRFISIMLPLGFIGWILEGLITTLIVRYVYRLRPEILRLEARSP